MKKLIDDSEKAPIVDGLSSGICVKFLQYGRLHQPRHSRELRAREITGIFAKTSAQRAYIIFGHVSSPDNSFVNHIIIIPVIYIYIYI